MAGSSPGVGIEKKTLGDMIDLVGEDIDLVKMNIHGSEYAVLMSTPSQALRKVQRIAVQYHELPASAKLGKVELFSHLETRGFQLVDDKDTQRGAGLAVLTRSAEGDKVNLREAV